jgi:LysR family carnitine catabolism transcriptional activator
LLDRGAGVVQDQTMPLRPEIISRQMFGHLSTFVAVAETLSFRQAAEIVGRSQPAVTSQINQLEQLLGVRLLVRTTRQVRLTAAGAELLSRAKKLLTETHRLVRDMQSHADLLTGQVVASFAPTIAISLVPRVLSAFENEYPGIRVMLREDLGPEMFEEVQTGRVDFGIGPYSRVPDRLTFKPIFEQEFFLILPATHPLAIRGHARVDDMADLNLLCSAAGSTAREMLDEATQAEGIVIRPKYEALQYPTLFALASAGFGATVMPAVNPDLLEALGLKAVPFRGVRLARSIGMITRRDEALAPAAAAFVRLLLLTAEQEGDQLGLG